MESKESVFILGAGFSRAVAGKSMPLLHELTKDINEKIYTESDNKEIKNIWQNYIEKPNIGNIRSVNSRNNDASFEDIMTFLSSNFAYEDYIDEHLKAILYHYITDLIVKVFERINQQKSILQGSWLHEFAKHLHNEHSEIFTFNYDLVLENLLAIENKLDIRGCEAIYSVKNMVNPYFKELDLQFDKQTGTLNIEENPVLKWKQDWHIKLYKLHGSINWLYDPKFPHGIRIGTTDLPEQYKQGLQALIVPPSMLKNFSFHTKLLDFQWQMFRKKLNNATNLYIIGYSIPTTDVATRYALQTQLNPKCKIFIISLNPTKKQKEEWVKLFDKQYKIENIHIIENGFNEESLKEIGIIQ